MGEVHVLPAIFMGIVALIAMWYPGFMLARNMVKAVAKRKPTAGENVLACIPMLNMAVGRTQLYGKAGIVYVSFGLTVFAVITRFILYLFFPEAIMLSFISLVFTWIVMVLCWLINGYVLWDMGTCTQAGFVSKLLAFIMPPLSQYIIGRNCIPMMAKAYADMEEAARQEEYVGNNH